MDVNRSQDVFQRLLELVSELTIIGDSVRSYYRKECSNLTRRVKVLAPLFEELKETGSIPANAIGSFREILTALSRAKNLLQDCRDGSQLAMVMDREEIISRFRELTADMSRALDGLPLSSLDVSDEVREQVEFIQAQLTKAKGRMSAQDENVFLAVNTLLEREGDGSGDHAVLQTLAEKLHLETEISWKHELRALEGRRNSVSCRSERIDLDRLIKVLKKIHPTVQDDTKAMLAAGTGAGSTHHSRVVQQHSSPVTGTDSNHTGSFTQHAGKAQQSTASLRRVESGSAPTPPNDFKCPISLEIMTDPVIVGTGQTYERACIRQWLDNGHKTCPKTGQELPHLVLTPNYVLRSLIASWCENIGLIVPKVDEELLAKQQLVASILAQLASDEIEVRRTAAGELRRQAKISPENRLCIAESGAIPVLVSMLSTSDSKTQEHAVTALLNLSIQESNKKSIVLAGAIDPIVEVLKHGSMEARENSAAALFSLSAMDAHKVKIGESGAIPALVQLLKEGQSRGKKDAATALFQLSMYQGNKPKAVRTGIVQPLMELVTDPTSGMVDEALAILAVLATHQEGRLAIGKEARIVPILVDLIRNGSPRNKENGASVLLLLCSMSNSSHAATARLLGAAAPIEELSQSGTARAKRKALELLQHVNEQDPLSTNVGRMR